MAQELGLGREAVGTPEGAARGDKSWKRRSKGRLMSAKTTEGLGATAIAEHGRSNDAILRDVPHSSLTSFYLLPPSTCP